MNDVPENNVTEAKKLIATLRRLEKNRALARRCVSLLLLGVIAVNICLLWSAIMDFKNNRLPEFVSAMGTEMTYISPKFADDLTHMFNRLYPRYIAAFQKTFERDGPVIKEKADEEMRKLQDYAFKRLPNLEAGILDVRSASEHMVREEMSKFVTPEEAEQISEAYGKALQDKYNEILSTTLNEHVKVAEQIGDNLQEMIATEPDIKQPIEMQEALGILLELSGVELQKGL